MLFKIAFISIINVIVRYWKVGNLFGYMQNCNFFCLNCFDKALFP